MTYKPEYFPKYGSIENLAKKSDILDLKTLVVTEKIHGTNVRVMFDEEDGLVVGSRNNIIYKDGERPSTDGFGFVKWLHEDDRWEELKLFPEHIFYGEFHGPGIQKGVKYSEEKDFRVFDIRNASGGFVSWGEVESICKLVNFKTVPVIMMGKVTIDSLEKTMDFPSVVAVLNGLEPSPENTWEGVVVKPYQPERDHRGNWIRAKYKSNKWAERAKGAVKTKRLDPVQAATKQAAEAFAQEVVQVGRVHTIVDHITRDGDTELSMKRTGDFVRSFIKDVMKDCNDVYDHLDPSDINIYNKAVSSLAVQEWKKYLIDA